MHPVLIKIGSLTIYSWSFMVFLGILVGFGLARKQAIEESLDPSLIERWLIYLVLGGVVGGRILYVLLNPESYIHNPVEIFLLQRGGMAIHGAILGGAIAGYLFSRRQNISFGKLADITAPALVMGQAIGRLGCFLNGDSYGRVTTLPWAVNFPGIFGARHPTQLYESFLDFLIFIFLWRTRKNIKFAGQLFLYYLILYSLARSFVEIFRESPHVWGPITLAQLASGVIFIISLAIIGWKLKTSNLGHS
jgi:phosphatidylglycerol:prolipoprotein diacylglycerol transferase